jgi:hypothetical protein
MVEVDVSREGDANYDVVVASFQGGVKKKIGETLCLFEPQVGYRGAKA